ncbi:serine/threonine-protein kinase Pink1, mitochondrial [Coccinella septempunctata]|uniref:serine/threonine-protein kinase Pink1, mitochondrial n=1 Tax=Coccinella septempunctata TaxID=41139 RepID=UPI001D077A6A|nr:serine/threonine-protein kinase Pink1, mitochondrial [Coccinella septempunctata]
MSIRVLGRLFKNGTSLLRNICSRDISFNIAEKINAVSNVPVASEQVSQLQNRLIPRNSVFRNVGVQIGLQARRILIDNVLNRVTNSLAADLRKKAAKRILFGDSAPFFALVGVSLASGTGIITKEEELEGVCWEIREAISKIKWFYHDVNIDEVQTEDNPITLKDLTCGKPIAQGANAVVYACKLKNTSNQVKSEREVITEKDEQNNDQNEYPFALKMMFNYDIQSNSMAILNAMYREIVPARMYFSKGQHWEVDLADRKRHLPPHPNIVAMFSVFTDYIPELESCRALFPEALPPRIYADGYGRNMSLFLLMKRYDMSLEKYLSSHKSSTRTSILLFCQLLEGVAHLTAHKIAHRDLKNDNLLIDCTDPDAPTLVISDFGCCLADRSSGLMLSYSSPEIDKGGNAALMAPEIYNMQPGTFSVLNYTKSDLWAAGAIGYEIFGADNPFYGNRDRITLRNATYKDEDLPDLPDNVPLILKELIKNILCRNPKKRLDPEIAANVTQLFLWAPSAWLRQSRKLPSSAEILQWLLSLTTKVLCERRGIPSFAELQNRDGLPQGRRTYPEYLLISSFLCRASIYNIRIALSWIQNNVYDNDY